MTRLRLQTVKNAAVQPSRLDVDCEEAPSALADVTNVAAATATRSLAVPSENGTGAQEAHSGKKDAIPDAKRSAPTGIDPWATM